MRDKPVTKVPGIGKKLGAKLIDKGFDKAYKLLGKFLSIGKDETEFKQWLATETNANTLQQRECYKGLRDWSSAYP